MFPAERVTEEVPGHFEFEGRPVNREYGKMGKSLNNVVTPDEMCDAYGADTFRVYEMSMGPLDISRPWQTKDADRLAALSTAVVASGGIRGDG